MYSIFFSKINYGMDYIKERLKSIIKPSHKVVILPWAFAQELDAEKFENEYFKKGDKRYNKYLNELKNIGIKEENIIVGNCYKDSKEYLKKIINESDILVLPGGNPEMFFQKVVHDTELLYDIKYYKGIIIGESAGSILQQKRYFITAKNNYYKYFAFYDGFGIINDPFYMDVHTSNNKNYLNKLQTVANDYNKKIYAIYDDGAILYNRKTNEIETFGNVKEIK